MYPGVLYCSAGVKEAGVQVWCRSSCQSSQNSAAIWVLLYEPLPLVLRIVWLSPNFGLQAQALDSKALAFAQSWFCVIFKSFTVGYIQWSFTHFGTKGVMFSATYKLFFVQWLLKLQPIIFLFQIARRLPNHSSPRSEKISLREILSHRFGRKRTRSWYVLGQQTNSWVDPSLFRNPCFFQIWKIRAHLDVRCKCYHCKIEMVLSCGNSYMLERWTLAVKATFSCQCTLSPLV